MSSYTDWTYDTIIRKGMKKLPNIDFGMLSPSAKYDVETKVTVRCKLCGIVFTRTIRVIFSPVRKHKCESPWKKRNVKKYLEIVERNDDIDFSATDIRNIDSSCNSVIKCKCKICGRTWSCYLRLFVYDQAACRNKCTLNILKASKYLGPIREKYSLKFIYNFTIPGTFATFDAMFSVDNINYVIQLDRSPFFKKPTTDEERRCRETMIINDGTKIYYAWIRDYKIIRVDYSQIRNIEYHIEKAVEEHKDLYLASPEKYPN
jgi:hypothetical protein